MKRVSFYTLGCKLNQAETSYLISEFNRRGYTIVPFGKPCDICVVNTCTVTSKADHKCHQAIRKVIKVSPQADIAVVGCYAQIFPDRLKSIPGVNIILGSDKKFDIFSYLNNDQSPEKVVHKIGSNDQYIHAVPESFYDQTRAFLKIQDGCNNDCSYCIVPYARGKSRSDKLENIVSAAKRLVDQGYKEIVLTGVHIGAYGRDLKPPLSLVNVLKELVKIPNLGRIRLSSLEPKELEEELLDFITQTDKICPHFHVPLQSGDDFILKRMKRNYQVSEYVKIIDKLVSQISHLGLGTDIIVGFPGETDERFYNTYQLVQELPFTYVHIFSFSPRLGTKAGEFRDIVAPQIKKNRSTKLIELGRQKKYYFYRQAKGHQFHVLFEENNDGKWMYGFTENYIRVRAQKQEALLNQIVPVCIEEVNGNFAQGKIIKF